jgi:hypothetical protein
MHTCVISHSFDAACAAVAVAAVAAAAAAVPVATAAAAAVTAAVTAAAAAAVAAARVAAATAVPSLQHKTEAMSRHPSRMLQWLQQLRFANSRQHTTCRVSLSPALAPLLRYFSTALILPPRQLCCCRLLHFL